MEENIQNINTQLYIIEKATKWVKETDSMKGAKGENAYRNLVNYRRKLNKKKFAFERVIQLRLFMVRAKWENHIL